MNEFTTIIDALLTIMGLFVVAFCILFAICGSNEPISDLEVSQRSEYLKGESQ